MSSSFRRADLAAQQGRGARNEETNQEYAIVLPSLPTGSVVLNTVFFHADVKWRPYRVEEFRDALQPLGLLSDVIALGAYQMNHVWAATFNRAEATRKILTFPESTVEGLKCLLFDPSNRDVRVKVHWLLHNIPDEDVKTALAPYGKVTEVRREEWRVQGCKASPP